MPRLSREDATRVIAALRRLREVDSRSASDLEVARVMSRLSCRITQAGVSPPPASDTRAIFSRRPPEPVEAAALVCIGRQVSVLEAVNRPGVELAVWQRDPDPVWAGWLGSMPPDTWPACRLDVAPRDAAATLDTTLEAGGTPAGPERQAFAADVARLAALFALLAQAPRVRLRLEAITGDSCRRWHRDCVPLRLICTYRGPGTQRVPPAMGDDVLSRPDDDAVQALSLRAADVALFKGCGWPGQPHDDGVVHRSPRISGTGVARLVLVLDAVWPLLSDRPS
jgi:hypothetical protein